MYLFHAIVSFKYVPGTSILSSISLNEPPEIISSFIPHVANSICNISVCVVRAIIQLHFSIADNISGQTDWSYPFKYMCNSTFCME